MLAGSSSFIAYVRRLMSNVLQDSDEKYVGVFFYEPHDIIKAGKPFLTSCGTLVPAQTVGKIVAVQHFSETHRYGVRFSGFSGLHWLSELDILPVLCISAATGVIQ